MRAILAALLLVACAAGLVPWPVPKAAVRAAVAAQASAGFSATVSGRASLTLLPAPQLHLRGVALRDAAGAVSLEAPQARVALRWLPLLRGRFVPAGIALAQPEISIDLDAAPPPAWRGRLSLRDGHLRYASAARGLSGEIAHLDALGDWPEGSAPLLAQASGSWRGIAVQGAAWLAHPARLARGGASAATLRLEGGGAALALSGLAAAGPYALFRGRAALDIDIGRLAAACGDPCRLPLPLPETLGLRGDLSASASQVAMENLALTTGGNSLEGVLAWRGGAAPMLSGTLAAETLAIDPAFLAALGRLDAAGWRGAAAPAPPGPDLDLRLSAARADIGPAALEEAALSLLRQNGALRLELGEARAWGGSLVATAAIDTGASPMQAELRAFARNVDLSRLCRAFGCDRQPEGVAGAALALEAAGATLAQALRQPAGRASLEASNGGFEGVDFESALRRLEKNPLAAVLEPRPGRTAFAAASATARFADGRAEIEGRLDGPSTQLAFAGGLDWRSGALAVAGRASQSGAARPDGPELKFDLGGTFARPAFHLRAP